MNAFKVGDRVVALNGSANIIKGEEYVVTHASPEEYTIRLEGVPSWVYASRFELAPEPQVDTQEIQRKVTIAYATALRHAHDGGSIQIHAGEEVVDYFKSLCTHPRHPLLNGLVTPRAFGFPIIPAADHLGTDHLSVHVVHPIY